jgi:DNA modification methylase
MNGITLYNDDCLKILNNIQINSIDLVIADLPYAKTSCKWDTLIDMNILWKLLYKVTKDTATIVMTAIQPFTSYLITTNLENFRYELIWEKPQGTNPLNAKVMPLRSHENILIFYKKRGTYNPQMWLSTPYKGFNSDISKIGEIYGENTKSKHRHNPDGSRYPKSILKFKQDKGLHPTQKPLEMILYLIKTFSNDGEIILDPTMGSGTTGVAAIQCNRKFIGIELDKKYFDTSSERIKKEYFKINNITNFFS